MTSQHFHTELEKIKKAILALSAIVEERVHLAIKAILNTDPDLAAQIIDKDYEVDEMEVEIEEECLKVIALYQPVAGDLRFLIAVIKINSDLERIADIAVNIAERVLVIAKHKLVEASTDYRIMGEKVKKMLSKSLDALVQRDSQAAHEVILLDDEIDRLKNDAYDQTKSAIRQHPEKVSPLLNHFLISRHLERIADHTTNVAEEVIYMIEGEIVRHEY